MAEAAVNKIKHFVEDKISKLSDSEKSRNDQKRVSKYLGKYLNCSLVFTTLLYPLASAHDPSLHGVPSQRSRLHRLE